MLLKTFAFLALAIGAIAHEAAPPQPRTNAEALARGLPILSPRHRNHGEDKKKNRPSNKPVPTKAGPTPDFASTCDWYDIEFKRNRPMLRALCKDNKGKKKYSELNLNQCIKLQNNGQLKCGPGGFVGRSGRRDLESEMLDARGWNDYAKQKCTRCDVVSDDTIECSCPLKRGGRIDASYTLGDCISNKNGRLTCKALED
ncbi:hypothetical protein CC85DRAFT_318984 [Cutaneotrichosporon oleaginosum]|uniref:Cyanovirin-N domain-containing protein n=1 Tax=Cutaneotrichosporon oleaginosum TaxID=879819 RepID=A0A0J0XM76_9TREE|nr:uncharacterized protein CC85DRAFT_318984 [Cutaneotrichosporon oleaginosum]KLT42225.1 hypothetical protein CC85DRAFT_318984 [Cutaneotrichosporon oleaginosum]TXT11399.1 hypothetical protein COLE_01809 [Cutaneotrichosporon oleaginosum]